VDCGNVLGYQARGIGVHKEKHWCFPFGDNLLDHHAGDLKW
jgi:hypothetical protein